MKLQSRYLLPLILLSALISAGSTFGQALSLPTSPLFVSQSVKPNLIIAIDDSGSMDSEVLFLNNDGALWWKTSATSDPSTCPLGFIGCGTNGTKDIAANGSLNFNTVGTASATWKKFVYIFPNGADTTATTGKRFYADAANDHYAIPPIAAYSWARSAVYNRAYFDPSTTYSPWTSYDTTIFSDATPTAALYDPTRGGGQLDLTRDVASDQQTATTTACSATPGGSTDNYGFRVFTGMSLPTGTCLYVPTATTCSGKNCSAVTGGSCSGSGNKQVCSGPVWTQLTSNVNVGDQAISGDSNSSTINDATTIFIRYFPATFYLPESAAAPAGYKPTMALLEGTSPNGTVRLKRYQIKPDNFTDTASYNAVMTNFANWFSYYRKRHMAMRGGVVASFNGLSNLKLGAFPINSRPATSGSGVLAMKDIDTASDRFAFYKDVYGSSSGSTFVKSNGTPNREAVMAIGQQYQRKDSTAPIQYACQKNFGILFTDGYANSWSDTTYKNADGTTGSPYADSVPNTMADTTSYFYNTTLRTDAGFPAGKVAVPQQCSTSGHAASLDCNTNLHMDFYGVTLGTQGLVFGVNAQQTADPYTYPPTWPTDISQSRNPSAVDDLWHATVNAHGQLYNAATPSDISTGFSAVLRSITALTASASSVSLNSASLKTTSRVYQASFNSGSWSGDLKSYPIYDGATACSNGTPTNAGDLCGAEWSAADKLSAQSYITGSGGRTILTYKPSMRTGVAFQIANLDDNQTSLLRATGETTNTNATLRLNYLRGDITQDGKTTTQRVRASKLGDIGDSSPFFVGAPSFAYGDAGYLSFRRTYASRDPMIYVGANDGMLHGFRAADGVEKLAYVPSKAFGSSGSPLLYNLTQTPFTHSPIVNGSPTVVDAYYTGKNPSAAWHSVLVAGLGTGGRGVYALDVTNPATFSESLAASTVMWEFNNTDDKELGFTLSQPSIVKMGNGKWAAIFGNGYASTADTLTSLGTGTSSLFIVFLDGPDASGGWGTGTATATARYIRISTGTGSTITPNGLASPAAVDTDGDGLVDYIYAGDLQGNLWRFDVHDSDPTKWAVGNGTKALFAAKDSNGNVQPITERPEVGYNRLASNATSTSSPRLAIYFGTGRYLDTSDVSTTGVQTFYGLFDNFDTSQTFKRKDTGATGGTLVKQQITKEINSSGGACSGTAINPSGSCFRVTTQNSVSSNDSGFFLDLYLVNGNSVVTSGERQVTTPVLRGGRIILTTLIPSTDVCSPGGGGWLMELNATNGNGFISSVFDTNGDGMVNTGDMIGTDAGNGVRSNVGIPASPAILNIPGNLEVKYRAGSGNGGATLETLTETSSGRVGRITWREVQK